MLRLAFSIPVHLTFAFGCLVEEANDLASNVLATGLLVVHDTSRGGEHDETELTSREQLDNPLLKLSQADVVAGGDDTALVEATNTVSERTPRRTLFFLYSPAVELNDDLAAAVVVDLLELADVA